jgi:uncharacterized protein
VSNEVRLLVEEHKEAIKAAVSRHRGRRVAVFGSVTRGDATEDSDVDFLVEFEAGSSLLDLIRIQDELSEILGRPVDVVSLAGLKPRDDRLRAEAVPL